jgi:hypothetical protein
VPDGAERHDPRVAGLGEGVVEAEGEREVPEVVGRELHLPALRGQLELGQRHHAGVVDEQVQRPAPARGEGGDRRAAGQVEPADVDVGVAGGGGDVGGRLLAGAGVAHGERRSRRRWDPSSRSRPNTMMPPAPCGGRT